VNEKLDERIDALERLIQVGAISQERKERLILDIAKEWAREITFIQGSPQSNDDRSGRPPPDQNDVAAQSGDSLTVGLKA
jgi:hypothetical protein